MVTHIRPVPPAGDLGMMDCPVCGQVAMALGQAVCTDCHRSARHAMLECMAVVDEDQAFHLVDAHLVPWLESRRP